MNEAAVVISAGGSPIAFDVIRSLGQKGIHTYVASSQADDIAYYSKYCAGKIPLREFTRENEQRNLHTLIQFAEQQKTSPVLYYASDPELSFLWRNKEQLSKWFKFLLPPDTVLEFLFNKVLFNSFALAYELPIPQTVIVTEAKELVSLISNVTYPCIVKPAFSEDWKWDDEKQQERFGPYKKALQKMHSPDELLPFCFALPRRQSGFLIQSYIEGRDENIVSFHGYFDEQSKCLGYFLGAKIRTYPPHTGGSAYVRTIEHPTLAQLSISALERIQFQGIVKIDFKWDSTANDFKILEINPRYNLWQLLGAYAGVNLVYLAYCHQTKKALPRQRRYRNDVRLLYLKQDMRAFVAGYRLNGEWSTLQYIFSLLRKTHFRVFDSKDIKPFVISLCSFLSRNFVRVFKRLSSGAKEVSDIRKSEELLPARSVEAYEDVLN